MLLQKEKKVNMTFAFAAKKLSVRALPKDVLVIDMDMGEMKTSSGIVIQSDDGKAHGIKPRWAKVYKVGTEVQDIKEGQWVLIEHGRWTRKIKIDDGQGEKEFQKVETKSIMMVADERPNDIYIGQEYGHGSSATIRPEDFGAR
jgi:co-chaperonin GroES (HSP10)